MTRAFIFTWMLEDSRIGGIKQFTVGYFPSKNHVFMSELPHNWAFIFSLKNDI